MAIIDNLNLLEDKLHYIMLRYTQISEENASLKEELINEKKNNNKLIAELDSLEQEKKKFDIIRDNVISKVEKLVYQLSLEDTEEDTDTNTDDDTSPHPNIEEELLEKELLEKDKLDEDRKDSFPGKTPSDFTSSSTTINFLPDEVN